MNIDNTRRMVFLLIFANAAYFTNCVGISSPSRKNVMNNEESNNPIEDILLTVASIIQRCVDESTMNNKKFKKGLDKMYHVIVEPTIQKTLTKFEKRVKLFRKKFEENKKLLEIMKESDTFNDNEKTEKKTRK